jgi:hypothetical protein
MTLPDRRGHPPDRLAIAHVAHLALTADLLRDRAQPVLAPPHHHACPVALAELAGDRLADPARPAGDDRYRHTRTTREVRAARPRAGIATARSLWRPFRAERERHMVE